MKPKTRTAQHPRPEPRIAVEETKTVVFHLNAQDIIELMKAEWPEYGFHDDGGTDHRVHVQFDCDGPIAISDSNPIVVTVISKTTR
jgi:hypothetical protein